MGEVYLAEDSELQHKVALKFLSAHSTAAENRRRFKREAQAAAAGLLDAGANLVGSNCGNGIEKMVAIAREFRACTDAPLLVQSNAGMPELVDGKVVYGETPEFMATHAAELLEAGVQVIGGCCGTTPEHIRALRGALRG